MSLTKEDDVVDVEYNKVCKIAMLGANFLISIGDIIFGT